jgi:1,4-alpha-glucan branching enzyme
MADAKKIVKSASSSTSRKSSSKSAQVTAKAETGSKKRITLEVQTRPGSTVFVAGSFNGWDFSKKSLTDKNGNGLYRCILQLEPGVYEYKFYINDTWCVDPSNPNFKPNEMGTLNSVIIVE